MLILADEHSILRAVQPTLSRHNLRLDTAVTGRYGLDAYTRLHPDLVLLDLALPDMDGLDVIRAIRQRASTPILVLSARQAEHDKVTALDLGADDYLTEPFGVNELLARIRVSLRHVANRQIGIGSIIRFGEVEVDIERRRVMVDGIEIHLTPTEWNLVTLFTTHVDMILTDRVIMASVWEASYSAPAHSLHVYIGRLRKKLEAPGAQHHIVTERGVGYRFVMGSRAGTAGYEVA